jgi:TRAP-type mannitol/chloroaromatic compound transport system permease large subunit
MNSTAKLSSFVLFILVGSTVFGLTFRAVNGDLWVEHLLTGLPGGQTGFLIVVNVMVFLLAFFLDFFELAFIIVPLLAPVADKLGIDLIWFGVLLGVNMQTSFMHPPFGFALFYLRSVAPAREYVDKITGRSTAPITTGQIYWGAVPFVVIQCIMVGILIAFPQLVTWNLHKLDVDPSKMELVIPEAEYGAESNAPPDLDAPGDPGSDSDASELERAFGGGGSAPDGGESEQQNDDGPTDLEKDFLR